MHKDMIYILLLSFSLFFSACSDTKKEVKERASSGMKCGAGKCGANMFDGKGALAKKKKNMLSQMRENDPRKECVLAAKNTKEVYKCVKNKETNKMSLKCGDAPTHEKMMKENPSTQKPAMKCGAGKCGGNM